MSNKDLSVTTFRYLSVLEALSFLLLLFIAMPLKYIWNMPEYVRVIGMAHGVLFVLYIVGSYVMYEKLKWSLKVWAIVMISAVLPFGPFYADRKYLPKN